MARHTHVSHRVVAVAAGLGLLAMGVGGAAAVPARDAAAAVRPPGVWLQLSTGTGGAPFEPGLARTKDGVLHVAWTQQDGPSSYSIRTKAISHAGVVLSTAVVVSGWGVIEGQPRLVVHSAGPFAGVGLSVVFNGAQDTNAANPYSRHARYLSTSLDHGLSWTLSAGSGSSHTTPNVAVAATTLPSGDLITGAGENASLWFHIGFDTANSPATTPDFTVDGQAGSGLENLALATDGSGVTWAAWYQRFQSGQGYYVEQLEPTLGPAVKLPSSGNPTWGDNEPLQQVAMASRIGGGVYVAYCQAGPTIACARVVIVKLGSSVARVVPGSTNGKASNVSLAAAPGGRLVISWLDGASNSIRTTRTNAAVTRFGALRSLALPRGSVKLETLLADGRGGRIDLVGNVMSSTAGFPVAFWHAQVLPGLSMTRSVASISHLRAAKVTFTVTEAGDPVAGVKVTFLGRAGVTNGKGVVTITVPKGQKRGAKSAAATKVDYAPSTAVIKVV